MSFALLDDIGDMTNPRTAPVTRGAKKASYLLARFARLGFFGVKGFGGVFNIRRNTSSISGGDCSRFCLAVTEGV